VGEYYRTFSDAARGATPGVTPDGGLTPPLRPAEPAPRPSITPLPLVRYTGDWISTEPAACITARSPSPSTGWCARTTALRGRMVARFKLPAGSPGDPKSGSISRAISKNTRAQTFALETKRTDRRAPSI